MGEITWLGWYDPGRGRPVASKLAEALARYAEKAGRPATACLCSPQDAAALPAAIGVRVAARASIPRHVFYVGREAPATACGKEE